MIAHNDGTALVYQQADDAEDFFLIRDGSFAYAEWPPWVVGTTAWDNWMVAARLVPSTLNTCNPSPQPGPS